MDDTPNDYLSNELIQSSEDFGNMKESVYKQPANNSTSEFDSNLSESGFAPESFVNSSAFSPHSKDMTGGFAKFCNKEEPPLVCPSSFPLQPIQKAQFDRENYSTIIEMAGPKEESINLLELRSKNLSILAGIIAGVLLGPFAFFFLVSKATNRKFFGISVAGAQFVWAILAFWFLKGF